MLVFSFLCFGLTIYFVSQLSLETMGLAAILSLLTFFYAVPLLKRSSLRNLGGIKIFIVGLVWAGVTVILPVVASKMAFDADIWLTFAQRFFMVLVLTLPFEIRDLHLDISALKTIPQQLGLSNTRSFGYFLLLATLALDGFKDEFSTVYFISLLIICAIIIGVLITSEENQRKHFASFWVEGIPIYWLVLLLLIKELF
jgi:4-hydroxybenzoate polyprenyltransferase